MNVHDILFIIWWSGCFMAFILALRSDRDAWILPQAYGSLILAFYLIFKFIAPDAPQHLHFVWYAINAGVDFFIVFMAWMLKGAPARKYVMAFGLGAFTVDMVYCVTAASWWYGVGDRLPGIYYFSFSGAFESLQVLSMIVFSGPIIPILTKGRNFLLKRKEPPWTHHRRLHRA